MLEWREVATIVGIMSAVNGGFLWACKAMLENQRNQFLDSIRGITSKNSDQDEHINLVREDLAAFKLQASEGFIRREDAIIYFGRFEQKIDAVWNHLLKMSQKPGGA